jgi:importin-9
MDGQVLALLGDTLKSDTGVIRSAEQALRGAYPVREFPFALLAAAVNEAADIPVRKAALTTLKDYVSVTWSPQFDETFQGHVYIDEATKTPVREQLLSIAASQTGHASAALQPIAAAVVGKIATADFPDQWPGLFETIVGIINTSNHDVTIKGALKVLYELIDSGLTEDQFFGVARELVGSFHRIAASNDRGLNVRAYALNVFQSSFDMLEMVMSDHGPAVKAFLDETLKQWMEFFTSVLTEPVPPKAASAEDKDSPRRGLITLKVQAVKTIDKVRRVHPAGLAPYSLALFQSVWQDLERVSTEYQALFVDGDEESKLADESDQLPYSVDQVVIEELDLLQVILKAPTVKAELNQQLSQQATTEGSNGWVLQLLDLLVRYARPAREEQEMWDVDIDLYLTDMSSVTLNYTPRMACSEVVAQTLLPWLQQTFLDTVLIYDAQLAGRRHSWKDDEALLYLLLQALKEAPDQNINLNPASASQLMGQISKHLQNSSPYVRAASHFVFGYFFKVAGESHATAAAEAFGRTVQASVNDDSDIVKVACFSAIPAYMEHLSGATALQNQASVCDAVAEFIASHDLKEDLEEADEVKGTLVTVLHEALAVDISTITTTTGLDSYLTLASESASSPILTQQLIDSFETLAQLASGSAAYDTLCSRTVPSLSSALAIGDLTNDTALPCLAAELLSLLAENGPEPLPELFLPTALPKLHRILLFSTLDTLVRPATTAVQFLLSKATSQYLSYATPDQPQQPALEVTLRIINRLLNSPDVDENAASEVGALASSVVTHFGADKLGPHLMELLNAVASRLASAENIAFIQSLCMVFVSLSNAAAKDVVDFLSQITIGNYNGLHAVMTKWLENSIIFAGFDEVRQNVVALAKIFSLHDQRIAAIGVKGDLIVENTGRIKTRSQAKNNPDRYTEISAELKILKYLVGELDSAVNNSGGGRFAALAGNGVDDNGSIASEEVDDDEWNDVASGGAVDLDNPTVRAELMGFDNDDDLVGRGPRDEEAAQYLRSWFQEEGKRADFEALFVQLTSDEQERLRTLAA